MFWISREVQYSKRHAWPAHGRRWHSTLLKDRTWIGTMKDGCRMVGGLGFGHVAQRSFRCRAATTGLLIGCSGVVLFGRRWCGADVPTPLGEKLPLAGPPEPLAELAALDSLDVPAALDELAG